MDTKNYSHLVSDERWGEQAYRRFFLLRFILLLIALILTLVVAYIYFVRIPQYESLAYSSKSYIIKKNTHVATTTVATTQSGPVDTSSWQSYTSDKKGFSFKYPVAAGVAPGTDLPVTKTNAVTEIAIPSLGGSIAYASAPSDLYSYKNTLESIDGGDQASALKSAVSINGTQVPELQSGSMAHVFFKHGTTYYVFSYSTTHDAAARTALSSLSFVSAQ